MASRAASLRLSFGFAWRGVRYVFASQRNARIQGLVAVGAAVIAALLRLSPPEWALLTMAIALVLVAETVNTAIESLTDLVTAEVHPLAARAKDVAAAAVWLAAVAAALIGAFLFLPRLLVLASPTR